MPTPKLSPTKHEQNHLLIGKLQSYIRKNALDHERMQRLKRFESLERSFNVKKISIKRPLQYYKVGNKYEGKDQNSNNDGKSYRMKEPQNAVSTLESLKNKIKSLEKDQISDLDLEIRLIQSRQNSIQNRLENTERQVRQMIQNYRHQRKRASQFRSEKFLQIIQIKKNIQQGIQRPKVKSLQQARKTSKDFMKSVYLKFINGNDPKFLSTKEASKKNLSLTEKKFCEQRMTNYRSKTENFWNECEVQSLEQKRIHRVNLFKAKHKLKI